MAMPAGVCCWCQECFEGVGCGGWAAGCGERGCHAFRSVAAADCLADGGAQAGGVQAAGGQPRSGAGYLDAAGDFELVAAERDGADGDAAGECLLGRAHAAVGDGAGGPVEDRA
jgi:hypothetical protein